MEINMKTAVMFTGIDALDAIADRLWVLKFPEVQERILEAQDFLKKQGAENSDILSFVKETDSVFYGNFAFRAFTCGVVQVGLYERYIKYNNKPDLILGCSLGDAARTVCSGAVSFHDMLLATYIFYSEFKNINDASIVQVKKESGIVTQIDFDEINKTNLYIAAVQTPRHFLVSGKNFHLKKWSSRYLDKKIYKIFPLYPKPVHSPLMIGAYEKVNKAFENYLIKNTIKTPIYSVVLKRLIYNFETLRADIKANMIGTINWIDAYTNLAETMDIQQFVSIGPAKTLIRFCERIPLSREVVLIDGSTKMDF
jgi:malonyl CoA-acyl carrier protein transacylase